MQVPFTLTANHGPSLCHHRPLWNHREWAVVEQLLSVICAASGALFEEAPRVATATLPRLLVGNQLPLCPIVESFTQSWLPQILCCSVTRSICSVWAGVFSQAVVGKLEDIRSYLSLPCLRGKPASSRVASVVFTALLCGPPTKQGGLSISCWTQKWCVLDCSLHRVGVCLGNSVSFPLSLLPGAQVLIWSLFFPFSPITCGSFLQVLLYRSPSASLQFVFSENCSTWCTFDVFVGRGELHVFLLHHLDLIPLKRSIAYY